MPTAEPVAVKLFHDKEWLAVLSLAQNLIPLEYDAPRFNERLINGEDIHAKIIEMQDTLGDLEIKFDEGQTYDRSYNNGSHPQTKKFIERFGLDGRLFKPRYTSGNKRTFNNFNQDRPETEIQK